VNQIVLLVARLSTLTGQGRPAQTHRSALAITGALALAAYATWLSAVAPTERAIWISVAILVASLMSSIGGFAFSAICGAVLFHLIDEPVQAVQIMMVCSVGGQSLMVWALRREIPWRALCVFLAGAAIGLPLGIFVLLHTRPTVYIQAVGLLLAFYAFFMMIRRPTVLRRQNALFDGIVGFLGGITGGAAALPGILVTIWCGFKGWSKEKQRALYQPFILIVQLAAIAVMALPNVMSQSPPVFDFAGIAYLPAMLLGSTIGMACFGRLSEGQFLLAVNLLLAVSGLSLLT